MVEEEEAQAQALRMMTDPLPMLIQRESSVAAASWVSLALGYFGSEELLAGSLQLRQLRRRGLRR